MAIKHLRHRYKVYLFLVYQNKSLCLLPLLSSLLVTVPLFLPPFLYLSREVGINFHPRFLPQASHAFKEKRAIIGLGCPVFFFPTLWIHWNSISRPFSNSNSSSNNLYRTSFVFSTPWAASGIPKKCKFSLLL